MHFYHLSVCTVAVAMWFPGGTAIAASSATQTVTFAVTEINEISVSGNPGMMTIARSTPGEPPQSVTEDSTRYAITANGGNSKITAVMDRALPLGLNLAVTLAAPSGATSAGEVSLGTASSDVVTAIRGVAERAHIITYKLSASAAVGVVTPESRTITLTVTAGAL